ncbi:dihydroxyacetone kinase subunit DhaK [candidate division WOR-3 bacterium]|nr:dihydroxyacetone kinase subunit DhaK [candidate division WOR-3 bacterium]
MKTFYNKDENYVDEMLEGILYTYPDLLKKVNGEIRAIARADAPIEGKVSIVTGGGSGHLPVFMGYVGKGLLDGAAIGNVFASPSMNQMLTLTKAVHGGKGVLYLYGNYSGDIMNFSMAAEMAEEKGIKVKTILVTDDIASGEKGNEDTRRGVAGLFYAYKVAGACADKGASLEEVYKTTKEALGSIRTLGVAISPCTVPGAEKPSFSLNEDEMEIGMGIHGEAGIKREKRKSADEITEDIMNLLFEDLLFEKNNEVSILVNSLGATPLEELFIIFRKIYNILEEKEIKLHKSFVGRYATSLEMAGFSITIFKLNKKFKECLDHQIWTPFVKEN